ncbi:hypothetical protein TNCV_234721 [Trichonephila clavipes]|uniref:Uncharacterized protein n=1 Tax=Trichonephila clavipes TaxID=2585209 RepID=A0A8X6STC0_TRICX|nr:hypothetical protein TNCV_234721 [Trichonephila clavipes]
MPLRLGILIGFVMSSDCDHRTLKKVIRFLACTQSTNLTSFIDANAVAGRRLINNNFKCSIPALNRTRTITLIIPRLRTKHVKGIVISTLTDKEVIQINAQTALMFTCIYNVSSAEPAIQSMLFKISPEDPEDFIFFDKAVGVSEVVFDSFGMI